VPARGRWRHSGAAQYTLLALLHTNYTRWRLNGSTARGCKRSRRRTTRRARRTPSRPGSAPRQRALAHNHVVVVTVTQLDSPHRSTGCTSTFCTHAQKKKRMHLTARAISRELLSSGLERADPSPHPPFLCRQELDDKVAKCWGCHKNVHVLDNSTNFEVPPATRPLPQKSAHPHRTAQHNTEQHTTRVHTPALPRASLSLQHSITHKRHPRASVMHTHNHALVPRVGKDAEGCGRGAGPYPVEVPEQKCGQGPVVVSAEW
jgi:hypothetical protein